MQGLTERQQILHNIIKSCQDQNEVMLWFYSLDAEDKMDAWTIIQMMMLDEIDSVVDSQPRTKMVQSQQVIDRISQLG